MRQKSLDENTKAREQSKAGMTSEISDIDDLLDDEAWALLDSLTEEEIEQLNDDFDPDAMLSSRKEQPLPERPAPRQTKAAPPRSSAPRSRDKVQDKSEPMFKQKDLVKNLDKMVAASMPVIQNEAMRKKEDERKRRKEEEIRIKEKEQRLEKEGMGTKPTIVSSKAELTEEEEELLAGATEEELMEAAALLNMNDILTADQINAVLAGDKPTSKINENVKSTPRKKPQFTSPEEEADLDIVVLNKHLKQDTDELFYLRINNQPKLEKTTLHSIISGLGSSKKMKHISLAMTGIVDNDCYLLAKAIKSNKQLETINLDSNAIGVPGIEAIMNAAIKHPSLREIKVSNQKQGLGGQGEQCMADTIAKNTNILKFGYSFTNAAARNKADRAIIQNNEYVRQKRKNGEKVYDLKEVIKIRDPWPQPWIRFKDFNMMGKKIENKVSEMGHMIDPDESIRESKVRSSKVREEREAKPLDIAALLAERSKKLKESKVLDLEKEQEDRRKKTLKAMQESEEEAKRIEESQESKAEEESITEVQEQEVESLNLDDVEKSPIASEKVEANSEEEGEEEEEEEEGEEDDEGEEEEEEDEEEEKGGKKSLRAKGMKVAPFDDNNKKTRKGKNKEQNKEVGKLNHTGFKVDEKVKQDKKVGKLNLDAFKVNAENTNSQISRRRSKMKNEEEGKIDFSDFEAPDKKGSGRNAPSGHSLGKITSGGEGGKEQTSLKGKNKSVPGSLDLSEFGAQKGEKEKKDKKVGKLNIGSFEKNLVKQESKPPNSKKSAFGSKKELPSVRRNKTSEQEGEKIDPFDKVAKTVSKLPSPESVRRRRKGKEEEEDVNPFKEVEERKRKEDDKKKVIEEERKEEETEEKKSNLMDISDRKKKLTAEGGQKIAPLDPVEGASSIRRKKQKDFEEPETEIFKVDAGENEKNDDKKTSEKIEDKTDKSATTADTKNSDTAERLRLLREKKERLAQLKGESGLDKTDKQGSQDTVNTASDRAERLRILREKKERLAAAKKDQSVSESSSTKDETAPGDDTSKSDVAERLRILKEKKERLAKLKTGNDTSQSENGTSQSEDQAMSLQERREKLAQKKLEMANKEKAKFQNSVEAVNQGSKIDVAKSLGNVTEDKPLSLKERRERLAEKKRLMALGK